jgi:hypothetical protein
MEIQPCWQFYDQIRIIRADDKIIEQPNLNGSSLKPNAMGLTTKTTGLVNLNEYHWI